MNWPNHPEFNLRDVLPKELVDDNGLDLLMKMLVYEPSRRITAK